MSESSDIYYYNLLVSYFKDNINFSFEEFCAVKYKTRSLEFKCSTCGSPFLRSKDDVCTNLKRASQYDKLVSLQYCNHCRRLKTIVTKPCKLCGKPVTKRSYDAQKHPNFFCSHSCAAIYNNIVRGQLTTNSAVENFSKKQYYNACQFKFGFDIPTIQGYELIEQYGVFSSTNNLGGVSRDHIFSVSQGWKYKVPPTLIAHPANCRIILHIDNMHKSAKSLISLDELKQRIEMWEKGLPLPDVLR